MMAFSARVPGLDFFLEESSDQQTWEVFFGCVWWSYATFPKNDEDNDKLLVVCNSPSLPLSM